MRKESLPTISVLVPCFNKHQYIDKCLDSILKQSFKNIEIVIIDDCSTDGTFELLNTLKFKDSRIKLFQNNENRGLTKTRVELLRKSSAKYVYFIDADDFLLPNALELLHFHASRNDSDVVKGWASTFIDGQFSLRDTECRHSEYVKSCRFQSTEVLWYHLGTIGQYLYKKELFEGTLEKIETLPFMAEDTAINSILLTKADIITLIDKPIFAIRRGVESLSSSTKSLRQCLDIASNYEVAVVCLEGNHSAKHFFLQSQLKRRFNELKSLIIDTKVGFDEAVVFIEKLITLYSGINILHYHPKKILVKNYKDCSVTDDVRDLAILLRYGNAHNVYSFFTLENDIGVRAILDRIKHSFSSIDRIGIASESYSSDISNGCNVHNNAAECRRKMEGVKEASSASPDSLMDSSKCLFEILKSRLIRLRRNDFNGADWQYFKSEVSENIEFVCKELDTRWLLSIAETYADYGCEVEQSNSLLISMIVNMEKTVQSNNLVYRVSRSCKPMTAGLNYHPSDNGHDSLTDLWDGVKIVCGNANEDYLLNLFRRVGRVISKTPVLQSILQTILMRMFKNKNSNFYHINEYILKFDLKHELLNLIGDANCRTLQYEQTVISYLNNENRSLKTKLQAKGGC